MTVKQYNAIRTSAMQRTDLPHPKPATLPSGNTVYDVYYTYSEHSTLILLKKKRKIFYSV